MSPRSAERRAFLAVPRARVARCFAVLVLGQTLWFALVYGGADLVTAQRRWRVPVHFEAELGIPFVPAMAWVYMSIYILFLSAPFILRSRRELRALAAAQAAVTLAAGICFLLIPAQLAYPPHGDLGASAAVFRLADQINLNYNLLPSLHVALGVSAVGALATKASRSGRLLLWNWALAVGASTLLTHQHHVADVAAGWLMGMAATRFVYARLAGRVRLAAPPGV